jgi:peptide/nickel transport system substrate-binding protein
MRPFTVLTRLAAAAAIASSLALAAPASAEELKIAVAADVTSIDPHFFNITIHGPSGRYVNDEKIVQAVAQMLSRVGINSKVETAPMGPYSGRASKQEFSFHMVGWGASTGEASSPLRSLLATYNRDKGLGAVNWGRYSNPKVDYLIVNDENRSIMLQRATDLAMADLGIMPIHFQFTMWATRKNVPYTPRTDEYTLAFQFKPVKGVGG